MFPLILSAIPIRVEAGRIEPELELATHVTAQRPVIVEVAPAQWYARRAVAAIAVEPARSPELEAVIFRALEKDRNLRYQHVWRNPASFAVALYCGIASSSLNALVNALDRLYMVRG